MNQAARCIRQLPPAVVNKIAAGEVIERPASVLKELLENAVDSGADRIEARLEQGGIDRVRVSDNGCGIPADQLTLALASHATSKIETADDLFAVQTLGFRGEALASIAEVSQLSLRSRVGQSAAAFEVTVHGGQVTEPVPTACAPGTTVDVRHLFFNTPVRRKFMRTVATELGHATEAFIRVALAFPQRFFSLHHHDRPVHELPPVESWRQRIAALFGEEVAESLIWVESEQGNVRLSGYVANPSHSRSSNKTQYLFLNGRHIRDRSLQHALGEAYRGLLLTGRYPLAFLQLALPPDQIDVNVHPTKLEVRFQDGGQVYSQLLSMIRGHFLTTDLTARVEPVGQSATGIPALPDEQRAVAMSHAEKVRAEVQQWVRGGARGGARSSNGGSSSTAASLRFDQPEPVAAFTMPTPAASPPPTGATTAPGDSAPALAASTRLSALQAHNRYLVTACEEGLMVIDQHALHERILYEQLREKVLAGRVEIQRLLGPEPVDLSPSEAAAVLEHQAVLREIGFEVAAFGGSTVLIHGYPAMLGSISLEELLRQLAAQLRPGQQPPGRRDVLDELLHMMSCKAAVKAGDPLTPSEVNALLEYRHLVQDAHHCPHGRPTTLVFTKEELDRRFKRT